MGGLDGCHLLAALTQAAFQVDGLAQLVLQFEGHAALQSFHQMATLGIERCEEFLLQRLLQAGLRTLVHTAGIVVASLFRFTINR